MKNRVSRKQDLEFLKTKRVLYIEDEGEASHQLSLFLKTKVGILFLAFEGQNALKAFKKYRPDVVLTDIKLPGMDGLELSRKIR